MAIRRVAGASREPDHRAVLEERARVLARPPATHAPVDGLDLVTFALANETYALDARYVHHVFRLGELTPLPGAAAPVYGVTSWRGGLLTVLDLRAVLGVSVNAASDLSRVIVIGERRPAFGVLADAVHDLASVPRAAIRTPPRETAGQRELVQGVTGDAVVLLDGAALLRLHHARG